MCFKLRRPVCQAVIVALVIAVLIEAQAVPAVAFLAHTAVVHTAVSAALEAALVLLIALAVLKVPVPRKRVVLLVHIAKAVTAIVRKTVRKIV